MANEGTLRLNHMNMNVIRVVIHEAMETLEDLHHL